MISMEEKRDRMRIKEYPELAGVIYGCCQDDFDDTSVVVRR